MASRQHNFGSATLLLATLLSACVCAQQESPLFNNTDPLELTLTAPMRTLVNQRMQRRSVDGTLGYASADGNIELELEVTPRGNNRLATCAFPPMWINLKRRQLEGTVFAGQNRLKLVTPCRSGSVYEEYLALEHLAYRIFETVGEHAFRTRYVRMTYVDTQRNNRRTEAPAFLIEHMNELATRTAAQAIDTDTISHDMLEPRAITIVALFEFLIGNTDWSALAGADGDDCCHNARPLVLGETADPRFVIAPYDFDQSGIVNAAYAQPAASLRLRSVRERLYRGFCATNTYVSEAAARFVTARPAIEALIAEEQLSDRARTRVSNYIAEGFEILSDPQLLERSVIANCRK